jgi:tetratricopeptide (TPR) repeat protein
LSRLGYWTEALSFNTQAHRQFAVSRQVLGIATAFSGFILYLQGHYAEAHQCVQTALGDWHARGDVDGIGLAFAYLAEIEAATGEVATAHEHFRRGLAIGRTIDRNGLVCFSLEGLGRLELEMGRSTRSAELYRESLAFGERSGMTDYHTSIALGGLGRAALALGDRAGARDFSQRALRYPVYWVHDRIEAIATLAQVFAAEGDMLRAVELLAFAVAHPATAHRVRQPLARLLAELECELPAEQFAVAAARGRARELDEVVAELTGEPARQAADGAAALI